MDKEQLKKNVAGNLNVYDEHSIPLEELKKRFNTDYENGLDE